MPQFTEKKIMNFVDNGSVDWRPVQANFENVFADMRANANEITALAQRQTWTIVKLFESNGTHTIMQAGKHLRCKCINAFAQLADSRNQEISCSFDGDTLKFTNTEGAGKARLFRLDEMRYYHFIDIIEVEQTEDRKVIYTFTFESTEEEK
jgi:hypothetical protein